MKKILVLLVVLFLAAIFCGNVLAGSGPAPNSGDGVSDHSGMDNPFQVGDPDVESPGPAPNSGDGVSDGSGF
jgi:hypothetical protein